MIYKKFLPSPELKPFVRCYYILEHQDKLDHPFVLNSSANPSFAITFNYGNRYQLYNKKSQGEYLPNCFLSGLSMTNYSLKFQGKVGTCGIIFQGTAFQKLIPIPNPEDIIDKRIDLNSVLGSEGDEVLLKICSAQSNQERIDILEDFLMRKLSEKSPTVEGIDLAVNIIYEKKGMLSIDELSDQINLSPRQFRRKFKERVGISPKAYARVIRFGQLNQCLMKNTCESWKEFIDDGGYYDQSHFIKDFIHYTGENPADFIREHLQLREQIIDSTKK